MKTHLIPEPQLMERTERLPQTRPSLGYAGHESPRPSMQASREETRRLLDMPMRNFLRVVFVH